MLINPLSNSGGSHSSHLKGAKVRLREDKVTCSKALRKKGTEQGVSDFKDLDLDLPEWA